MSHTHAHGHDHDHSHAPAITADNEKKVLLSFFLIFGFMIVEVVGGVLSGSLALIADAGHMLTDAAALALAYAAFRIGRRVADGRRTFGYLRLEVIAGFVNAVALLLLTAWIIYEAIERFRAPAEILAGPMFWVAVAGLAVNLGVLWILTRGESEHVNIRAAVLHVVGDLLGSVGAVGAAIVIHYTGWTPIDPILSVIVSLLIVRSAWKLLRNTLNILLEGAPEQMAPDKIERHLKQAVPGVAAISHVHVWSITSGRALATLHVRLVDDTDARTVVRRIEQELKSVFEIEHATVAVDWGDGDASCCLTGSKAQNNQPLRHGDHASCGHDHAEHRH